MREEEPATRRRRRTPEAAQREIIEAAGRLLRERPFRELTVDEVMRRTGLSRPSFYVYFKDRHELVLRLVTHLQDELLATSNRWYRSPEGGPEALRYAIEGTVAVYESHAPVMRALADAAVEDPQMEQAYDSMIGGIIDVTAAHVEKEIRAGLIAPLDATEVSNALVWMTERYLYHSFGPTRRVPPGRVVETLAVTWTRALYQLS